MEKLNIKNVEILPYAVGDVEKNCGVGIDDYFYKKFGYAAHNAQLVQNKNGKEEIKRVDSFNFDNVGFIKIDVEGYELNVLKGAIETIKRFKPLLFIETIKTNSNNLENFLSKLNYFVVERYEKDILYKYNKA